MPIFNEDTRVKIPAVVQFLRNRYEYQSLKDIDLHAETRIAVNRFKPAIERINSRTFSDADIAAVLDDIHATIRNNDMGKSFYRWLINPQDKVKLVDVVYAYGELSDGVYEISVKYYNPDDKADTIYRRRSLLIVCNEESLVVPYDSISKDSVLFIVDAIKCGQ